MSAGFAALGHDDVHASLNVLERMLGAACHRADLDAPAVQSLNHIGGRRPHGAEYEFRLLVSDHNFEDFQDALLGVPVARRFFPEHLRLDFRRQRRNSGVIQHFLDEVDVRFRQGLEAVRHRNDLADLVGEQYIDAVRLAAGLLIHVGENPLKFVGLVIAGRQRTHPARIGHFDGDFRLMGETKDRDIDAEHLRNAVSHGTSQCFCLDQFWASHFQRPPSQRARAIRSFITSLEPPQIFWMRPSVHIRATGYSSM